MTERILPSIVTDLEVWEPQLPPDRRRILAERITHRLESTDSRAEYQTSIGETLAWLFDSRSGRLLVTYPSGANRIRLV